MGNKAKTARQLAEAEHDFVAPVAAKAQSKPVVLMGGASEIADQPPLVVLSVATIAVGALLRRRDIARTGVHMLLAHALATGGKTVLKRSIDRARPGKALEDGKAKVGASEGPDDSDYKSFPSGHTAGAVSVAEAIARTAPRLALPVRSAAGAIAAVQVPRGAHYPSDVLVGAAIGWTAERLATALLNIAEVQLSNILDNRG